MKRRGVFPSTREGTCRGARRRCAARRGRWRSSAGRRFAQRSPSMRRGGCAVPRRCCNRVGRSRRFGGGCSTRGVPGVRGGSRSTWRDDCARCSRRTGGARTLRGGRGRRVATGSCGASPRRWLRAVRTRTRDATRVDADGGGRALGGASLSVSRACRRRGVRGAEALLQRGRLDVAEECWPVRRRRVSPTSPEGTCSGARRRCAAV